MSMCNNMKYTVLILSNAKRKQEILRKKSLDNTAEANNAQVQGIL